MARRKRSKRELLRIRSKIALKHIQMYFNLALQYSRKKDYKKADYCIRKIRWIAKNFGIKIPKEIRYFICRKCKKFMFPSQIRIRIRNNREPHITITCPRCGTFRRIPIKRREEQTEK